MSTLTIETTLNGIYGEVKYCKSFNTVFSHIDQLPYQDLSFKREFEITTHCSCISNAKTKFILTGLDSLGFPISPNNTIEVESLKFDFINDDRYYKMAKLKKLDDLKSAIISSSIKHSNTTKEDI